MILCTKVVMYRSGSIRSHPLETTLLTVEIHADTISSAVVCHILAIGGGGGVQITFLRWRQLFEGTPA